MMYRFVTIIVRNLFQRSSTTISLHLITLSFFVTVISGTKRIANLIILFKIDLISVKSIKALSKNLLLKQIFRSDIPRPYSYKAEIPSSECFRHCDNEKSRTFQRIMRSWWNFKCFISKSHHSFYRKRMTGLKLV